MSAHMMSMTNTEENLTPTVQQIIAAKNYVDACANVGLTPDAAQLAISHLPANFGVTPGEPDAIEATISPETGDTEDGFTPATAWLVLNDEFSVCLTRVTAGEDAGDVMVSVETLNEEPQRVLIENITGSTTLFHGNI